MISIHAPREGSDLGGWNMSGGMIHISIHAPREGSDAAVEEALETYGRISIHAPREGSDGSASNFDHERTNFNPRSP